MAGSVTDVAIFSAAFEKDKRETTKSRVRQYLDNYFFDMKYFYYSPYKRHENYSIFKGCLSELKVIILPTFISFHPALIICSISRHLVIF